MLPLHFWNNIKSPESYRISSMPVNHHHLPTTHVLELLNRLFNTRKNHSRIANRRVKPIPEGQCRIKLSTPHQTTFIARRPSDKIIATFECAQRHVLSTTLLHDRLYIDWTLTYGLATYQYRPRDLFAKHLNTHKTTQWPNQQRRLLSLQREKRRSLPPS
jgi:hypothetical protein